MSEQKEKTLTVYIMGEDDIHIGMTGNDEAPIAIIVPKAGLGIGLPISIAHRIHDALCNALALVEDKSDEEISFN